MNILQAIHNKLERRDLTKSGLSFSSFNLTATIAEVEDGTHYELSGFNTGTLTRALHRTFGKAGSVNIWTKQKMRTLTIHRWFIPELLYMIREVKKTGTQAGLILNQVEKLILEESWFKSTLLQPKQIIDRSKIKANLKWDPLPIQEQYFEKFDKAVSSFGFRGALAALAAGSGKSFASLCVAEGVGAELVVIVCPKPTLYDPWEKTIPEVYKTPQNFWSSSIPGPAHLKSLSSKSKFVILHYEQIEPVMKRLRKTHGSNKKTLVILDESHNLNNVDSHRTAAYLDLVDEFADYVVALSGTPIKAVGSELIPMLRAIDPEFTALAEKQFLRYNKGLRGASKTALTRRIEMFSLITEKKELGLKPYIVKTIIVKLKNGKDFTLPVVTEKMKVYAAAAMIRYTKARPENLIEYFKFVDRFKGHQNYPNFRYNLDIIIASTNYMYLGAEMKIVNTFESQVVYPKLSDIGKRRFKEIRAAAKYPALKVLGETLGVILSKERIRCNAAIAAEIDFQPIMENGEGKTLVFSNNVAVAKVGHNKIKGSKSMLITGETSSNLARDVIKFTENDSINPLFTTYASLSTGVPIVCVSEVVIMDAPYREYTLTQSIARAHRLGNDKQVTVWYIQLDTGDVPNLNSRSLDLAKWSSGEVSDILGIGASTEFPDGIVAELVE